MNWLECDEIEAVPGKMGGRPVIKGTRIEPETVIVDEEYGRTSEQTHESYPTLSIDTILKIRAFAHKVDGAPVHSWRIAIGECGRLRTAQT
jgi:uncharacterized protein (DUF433 family)